MRPGVWKPYLPTDRVFHQGVLVGGGLVSLLCLVGLGLRACWRAILGAHMAYSQRGPTARTEGARLAEEGEQIMDLERDMDVLGLESSAPDEVPRARRAPRKQRQRQGHRVMSYQQKRGVPKSMPKRGRHTQLIGGDDDTVIMDDDL